LRASSESPEELGLVHGPSPLPFPTAARPSTHPPVFSLPGPLAGKFEFGDAADAGPPATPAESAANLGEVLSGGVAALPSASGAAERERTREAQRIIGMVEPQAAAVGAAAGPSRAAAQRSASGPSRPVGGGGKDGKDCVLQ